MCTKIRRTLDVADRKRVAPCRWCGVQVQRPADEYCSDSCASAYEHHTVRVPGRESVECQTENGGDLYLGGWRMNLQNSA